VTRTFPHSLSILTLLAGLAATACGNHGSSSVSPTAPSSIAVGSSASVGSGAVITGRVTGVAATSPAQMTRSVDGTSSFSGPQFAATDSNVITVTIVGTNTATTVGSGGDFTLTGVPPGTVQLQFTGRGMSGTLSISGIGPTDRIELSVALTSSGARVESENRHRDDTSRVEVNGRVRAVGAGTLTVGTTVVTVPTGVPIRHGSQALALADIKVGDHVEVKGTRTTAGVTASEVKVESESNDDDNDDDEDGEDEDQDGKDGKGNGTADDIKGPVASLGVSACPSLSFVIKGVTVTTSATTKFDGIACSAIKEGTSLEVKGARTGNVIAATKVERD
jgi:hypothetical protein